jgi:alpha-tubulin suppressor-like RCC1 family protein
MADQFELADVSAGFVHTCGLDADGHAFCWGDNAFGQLGNGDASGPEDCSGAPCSTMPIAVETNLQFAALSAGGGTIESHTCALRDDGRALCWGSNGVGQLGIGDASGPDDCSGTPCSAAPVAAETNRRFGAVSAGGAHTCALTAENGRAFCWGSNEVGQLGNGDASGPEDCSGTPCSTAPVAVETSRRFAAVSAGASHTCALTAAGRAFCWGNNGVGQLGDGTTTQRLTPVAVETDLRFAALNAGGLFTCGLVADGHTYCWGQNEFAQLGVGTNIGPDTCGGVACSTTPVAVETGRRFAVLSAGAGHTCAVTVTNSRASCWGANGVGSLGTGNASGPQSCAFEPCSKTPIAVETGMPFAVVSAGGGHSCALTLENLGAFCWGNNRAGQLGNGDASGPEDCSGVPCSTTPIAVVRPES